MKFTIDDRPAVLANQPPSLQRVETVLRALPDGKLVTAVQLCGLANISHGTMMRSGHVVARELSVHRGNKKYYGNKKTIQAFKDTYHL